jgi:hypothetical protein
MLQGVYALPSKIEHQTADQTKAARHQARTKKHGNPRKSR